MPDEPFPTPRFCPGIPGLEGILGGASGQGGFAYYPDEGLNIVLHGAAGSGKTLFALQCAMGAIRQGKNVIFLTKDTSPETLLRRLNEDFRCFDMFEEPEDRTPWIRPSGAEKEVFWSPTATLVPDPESSIIVRVRRCIEGLKEGRWRVALLDKLAERLERGETILELPENTQLPPGKTHALQRLEDYPKVPSLVLGSLGLLEAGEFDRYAANDSIYDGLSRLCPRLRPLFEKIGANASMKAKNTGAPDEIAESKRLEDAYTGWRKGFLVVCDSLPVAVLEDCLRAQTEGPAALTGRHASDPDKHPIRPLTLFAMESGEMPEPMTAAFPPDVQIKLGFREELHSKKTRTIQVLKSRFQEIQNEPFPFTILGCKPSEYPKDLTAQLSAAPAVVVDLNSR